MVWNIIIIGPVCRRISLEMSSFRQEWLWSLQNKWHLVLKTTSVTNEQADLPCLLRVLKPFFLTGGGSEKGCLLKTAAVNSELADLPYLLRVLKPLFFLVVALKRAVHCRPPLSPVNWQISPICSEFWNPFSFWWWLWKGLFTEDCRYQQWTSRSCLFASSYVSRWLCKEHYVYEPLLHWQLLHLFYPDILEQY